MRKPQDIVIDRALLVYLLHLAEPYGLIGDVRVQLLVFLCELQMLNKGLKGFHFEFFRYAYGVFSKDLDNDLLALRKKERLENLSPSEKAAPIVTLFEEAVASDDRNGQILEVLRAVLTTYGPQETDALTRAVEGVEVNTPEQPETKLTIREVSFHSMLLVPSRIEVEAEFTLSPPMLGRFVAALGA